MFGSDRKRAHLEIDCCVNLRVTENLQDSELITGFFRKRKQANAEESREDSSFCGAAARATVAFLKKMCVCVCVSVLIPPLFLGFVRPGVPILSPAPG